MQVHKATQAHAASKLQRSNLAHRFEQRVNIIVPLRRGALLKRPAPGWGMRILSALLWQDVPEAPRDDSGALAGPAWLTTGWLFDELDSRALRRRQAAVERSERWKKAFGRTELSHKVPEALMGEAGCASKLYVAILALAPVDDSFQLVGAKYDLNWHKIVGGRIQPRRGGGGFKTGLRRLAVAAGVAVNTVKKHLKTLSRLRLIFFETLAIGTYVQLAGYSRHEVGEGHRAAVKLLSADDPDPGWLSTNPVSKKGNRSPSSHTFEKTHDLITTTAPQEGREGSDLRSRLSDLFDKIGAVPDFAH